MDFVNILTTKRSDVIKRWFDHVVKTYPSDSAQFLLNIKDQFSNPIGATTHKALEDVFDALISGKTCDELIPLIDPAIRIKAVQQFSPSASVAFVLHLKSVVRDLFEKEIKSGGISRSDLELFDQKVDGLCLIAFDIYMGCREQIFTFKADQVKSRTLKLLEKADILCEVPDVGTEIIPHNVYKNGGFDGK